MSVRDSSDMTRVGGTSGLADAQAWTRVGDPRSWREQVHDNPVFGDERLALETLGVFARVLNVRVGEVFSAATLAASGADSVATAQAALDELAARGYLAGVAR
ncbi:hypothetical protein [Streptomyces sp. PH10-H1]|uniref:hypothetical protein n=1 Tax=Streptomyces sp. PH10-H1 TaxID=3046212 RepID=UPI0024B9C790|nr:hypothetical protein [Streptomyces sp. PH10-H1]MDJ0347501.1 hypothetical protein [Streptomyces sp. PH10-H1]